MLEVAIIKSYFSKIPDFTSSSTSVRCEVCKPPLLQLSTAAELFVLWLHQEILVIVNLQLLVLYAACT